MQFLYKTPGYLLLLFGGFCLSWGGFIIRSFEEASVWQILLLRSIFFMLVNTGYDPLDPAKIPCFFFTQIPFLQWSLIGLCVQV